MNKSRMMDLAKKYKIHIILFAIAFVIRLSVGYTLSGWDTYDYLFAANGILQNHTFLTFQLPQPTPSPFNIGYPLLIVPFIYFFGMSAQSAVYPCVILGALTVVILYEFTKDLLDWRAALFASLFLIFSYHWHTSSIVMTEAPALFFMLLSIFAAVKYVKTEKAAFVYLFYFAAGFACLIRYPSALIFVILGLYILLSNKTHLLKRKEVWLGIPLFFVILSPQLIHNHIYFGSPFTTGYSHVFGLPFSLQSFSTPREDQFNIIRLIKYCIGGFGTPILPFFLYGVYDWIKERKREELSLILPWIAVPIIVFSFGWVRGPRYIYLVFFALLILSGHGFSKICDTPIIKKKTVKKILIVSLVVILLIPTSIFWFDFIQVREACAGCQKETFGWIHEYSGDGDIILSYGPVPSYRYYSQREVYSLRTSHDELDKLISSHNNTYLAIRDVWRSQRYYMLDIDTEQWLNETYGVIHLKTFESEEPKTSLISKLLSIISNKTVGTGTSFFQEPNRWDVYLVVK